MVSIRIRDEQPGSYFLGLRNLFFAFLGLKYFDEDPGWRQFGSGMEKSRIRDKHPGSATLRKTERLTAQITFFMARTNNDSAGDS
jgi:hypothetical protein